MRITQTLCLPDCCKCPAKHKLFEELNPKLRRRRQSDASNRPISDLKLSPQASP